MEVKRYQAIKYALSEIVRALPWRSDTALRNRTLFERLAMDRFNVAVVGRYSRGKSTLLNALTGLDRLPMGAEPLTSVITSLRYGTDEKAIVHFRGTSLTEDIPLPLIKGYVTEHGNHANRRNIQEVEIILQSPILKSGFRFIDTPGLGSIIRANTETTLDFLSEIDVFVFVTACDLALGADEHTLLKEIASTRKPLFPVLNKADLASNLELLQRSEGLCQILHKNGLMENDRIFCLSAVQALEARLSHDNDLLQLSGLPVLEQALSDFLLRRRRKTFLTDMCDRLTDAIKQDAPNDAAFLLSWVENIRHEVTIDKNDASHTGQNVQDVFRGKIPPCPVCQHVEKNVFDHLTFLQGALSRRQIIKTAFLQDDGLCAFHMHALQQLAAPREIATACAPLFMREAARLRECADGTIQQDLRQTCSACDVAARTASKQTGRLAHAIDHDSSAQKRGAGLCQAHFERVIEQISDPERKKLVLYQQATILERLADDMNCFALKQDAGRSDAITQSERYAARSGIDLWSGLANAWIRQPIFSYIVRIKDGSENSHS